MGLAKICGQNKRQQNGRGAARMCTTKAACSSAPDLA
eukprot:CAMPEP_0117695948 /NCGR_PEP_ID=MMETSP0804-20121206/28416_1 /TAXON_ID=1074897 /ORGANISM="Tetraselmis astigmatica, Strain CCMP880" /LENGTH=36 /DNA_ID= /DNA_START= /DNA_END= /DNA_ORIENTATION=